MPNHMVIAESNNTLPTIVDREVTCVQSVVINQRKLSIVDTVSANSSVPPIEQTMQDETVDSN